MTMPDLTLNTVKEKAQVKAFRASDFLTKEQVEEVHKSNIRGKKKVKFDQIDAYIAEIIARFGYDTYVAWKFGEINESQMVKYVEAERSRDAKNRLTLESLILAAVSGANHPTKTGHAPKSLHTAIKMLKKEQKLAEGGR